MVKYVGNHNHTTPSNPLEAYWSDWIMEKWEILINVMNKHQEIVDEEKKAAEA